MDPTEKRLGKRPAVEPVEDPSAKRLKATVSSGDAADEDFEYRWSFSDILARAPHLQRLNECWAEVSSAIGEARYYIDGGVVPDTIPSVQHMIDCRHCDTSGLGGGYFADAADFMEHIGVALDGAYPRRPRDMPIRGPCLHCPPGEPLVPCQFGITGYRSVGRDEMAIHRALRRGPLAVLLIIDAQRWREYRGGIASDGVFPEWTSQMPPEACQHYVTLVGHGMEAGQYYWVLRNTYGPFWGEEGHMRLDISMCDRFQEVYALNGAVRY